MQKYLKILSPVVFLLCIFMIFVFKTVPAGKLWKDYAVLYVQKEADDTKVLDILHSAGVKNEIALSNQYLPINLAENSIEITMFRLNANRNNYHDRRVNYFFDRSQNLRLYYIPNEFSQNLSDAVSILSQNKIKCGIDTKQPISVFLFITFVVAIFVLTFFSKNRILFSGIGLVFLIYIWCNPFYPASVACIISLLPFFFISNTWRRKSFVISVASSFWTILIFASSIFCCFSISAKSGFMFLLCLCAISSYLYVFYSFEDYFVKKNIFVPVFIKSAKQVSIFAKKSGIIMTSMVFLTFLTVSVFFISSGKNVSSIKSEDKISFPANVNSIGGEISDNLPQLDDYYSWVWNIKTYPYKSLNQKENDSYIEFSHYIEEDGKISETKKIFSFNQTFKNNAFDDIDGLQFESIEKVLKSEGKDFAGGYVTGGTTSTSIFSVIMMIFCFIVLLFIYFSIIILKLRKLKK